MANRPNGLKLWIDDERPPPNDEWTWAKGYVEAMTAIRKCCGEDGLLAISFDHDLGEGGGNAELTGHDIAVNLAKFSFLRPETVMVHTQNPVGRDKIVEVVKQDMGYSVLALVNIGACKLCPLLVPSKS